MSINGFGPAQGLVSPLLSRVASGWIDKDMVTIRKMAAAGATADEIARVLGGAWTAQKVISFIRRNKLVWNRKSAGRHMVTSAAAIGTHAKLGHAQWAPEATKLRQGGMSCPEIGRTLNVPAQNVIAYFNRHNIKPLVKVRRKRMANRQRMLALIIRLHVEQVLSEGQVQAATGLDRIEIRRLADETCGRAAA